MDEALNPADFPAGTIGVVAGQNSRARAAGGSGGCL